jgi:iron complex transport system ATP-binding protein
MLQLHDIHFAIDNKTILEGVSAHFDSGKIHGIIGPNGSGKSTILRNICRIWEPQTGLILVHDKDYRSFSRKDLSKLVTMVPQHTMVRFPVPVYDIVAMGRNPHLGRFESLKKIDQEKIDWALKQTNIYDLKDRNINELSGGESQLSIIARALATEAEIILLDEPTSELDIKHTLAIISILYTLKNQGKTILVTMHDLNLARKFCDSISIIHRGKIFFSGMPEQAFSEQNIRQVFEVNVREIKKDSAVFLDFYS